MATEKRRKKSGARSGGQSAKRSGGRTAPSKKKSAPRRRAATGTRLAIAIVECLVMVAITGAVLFLLNRSQPAGSGLPQVYTANLPSPGEGTLVLSTESVFTGSDGSPCLYRLEGSGGSYYVRAVSVQTQAYDEGRVAVTGVTEFEVPYVMAATAPLQDGAQVELAK